MAISSRAAEQRSCARKSLPAPAVTWWCAAGIDRPRVELRKQAGSLDLLVTDGGNHILDCHCGRIPDAEALAARLSNVPGVVEHGLFINIARTVIIGNENGATVFEF